MEPFLQYIFYRRLIFLRSSSIAFDFIPKSDGRQNYNETRIKIFNFPFLRESHADFFSTRVMYYALSTDDPDDRGFDRLSRSARHSAKRKSSIKGVTKFAKQYGGRVRKCHLRDFLLIISFVLRRSTMRLCRRLRDKLTQLKHFLARL